MSTDIAVLDAELTRLHAAYATLAQADEDDIGAWTARLAADRQYRQLLAQLGEHPAQSPADVGVKARWLSIEQAEAGGSLCEMEEVNPLLASLLSDVQAIG